MEANLLIFTLLLPILTEFLLDAIVDNISLPEDNLSHNPEIDDYPEVDPFPKISSEETPEKSAEGEKPGCWLSEASKILVVGFLLFSTAVAMVLRAAHDAVYHVLTLPDDGDTAKVFVIWWLQYSWSPDTDLKVITAIARWFRDRYDL